MKKIKINARSILYSIVGILISGSIYFMLYTQIPPEMPPESAPIVPSGENEHPDGETGSNRPDKNNPDYEEYPNDSNEYEEYEPLLGKGLQMNGYILGDNSYQVSPDGILDYIGKGVFRYKRWNPMAAKNTEPAPETPAVVVPETPVVPEPSGGIVLKLTDGKTVQLEYTSGKYPVKPEYYEVTKIYGLDGAEMHYGIDISKDGILGQDVYSVLPGIVSNIGNTPEYGEYVVVNHGSVNSLYAHLDKNISVTMGERLLSGDKIGTIGDSGQEDGPHLHFEMDVNSVRLNPEPFFKDAVQ